jgi:hypothetical protein
MSKWTATAGEIIAALSKFPADTPVFLYNDLDEGDAPVEICEIFPGPIIEDGAKYVPHYCKGYSYVKQYWEEQGECPVIYLRDRGWCDRNFEFDPNKMILT